MMRRHHHQVDDGSLQADVMRFMAIVAFCLIAILAMVRNVEPTPPEPAAQTKSPPPAPVREVAARIPEPVASEPEVPIKPQPIPDEPEPVVESVKPDPDPIVPAVVATEIDTPEVNSVQPVATSEAKPKTVSSSPPPEPVLTVVESRPAPWQSPDPTPRTTAQAESKQPPPAAAATNEEEGLSLRFTSEADFLRLVARGKVAVYAFNDDTFLELDETYQFRSVPPPRQVYELDASTIPNHLIAALRNTQADSELKWAVGLPSRVQRQIRRYLSEVASGQLLIDRFEEVHHVASN